MRNKLPGDTVIDQIKEITLFSLLDAFEIIHVNSDIIFITLAFFHNFHNFSRHWQVLKLKKGHVEIHVA